MTATTPVVDPDVTERADPDHPWVVIVWDDPVNLMDFVVYVFQQVLGHDREKATALMLSVHNEGKAVVFTGMLEPAELAVYRLHNYGLWATMERS
jgi:ATP-dependent Clp protease adaptor protein ClpS